MVRVNASRTSRGAHSHIRALWECLTVLIEDLDELVPLPKRVHLRNMRAALERTHANVLKLTESDVAQLLEEEDGQPFEEVP